MLFASRAGRRKLHCRGWANMALPVSNERTCLEEGFAHRCNGRESINETAIFLSWKADPPVAGSALETLMARASFRIIESSHSFAEVEQVSKLVCKYRSCEVVLP